MKPSELLRSKINKNGEVNLTEDEVLALVEFLKSMEDIQREQDDGRLRMRKFLDGLRSTGLGDGDDVNRST